MSNVQDEITRQLAEMQLIIAQKENSPVTNEVSIPVEVAPVVVIPEPEPIVKTAEPIIVPVTDTKAQKEAKLNLYNWCKTRLNIILVQTGTVKPIELKDVNGSKVYMNLPLNTLVVSEEEKHSGYLNKYLRPFAKALKDVTKPNSVNQLGTVSDSNQLYRALAIAILENTAKLLPRSALDDRVQLLGDIATETNSLVNEVILEFYLVYETEYLSAELLEKLSKIEKAVKKDELDTESFSINTTVAFPLHIVPTNLAAWHEAGYTSEDYVTTQKLPVNQEHRLLILGAIPTTKKPLPHIILSKKM